MERAFLKRSIPYAMFATFDGVTGETCLARREVSNTPLQALTMLNDLVVLEAAQTLGRQTAESPGSASATSSVPRTGCRTRRTSPGPAWKPWYGRAVPPTRRRCTRRS